MQAPLTSLDPVDWLVFSDWSADHDRTKAEAFARKTAHALLKLLAVGADPRCCIVFEEVLTTVGPGGWPPRLKVFERAIPYEAPIRLDALARRWDSPLDGGYVVRRGPYWMTRKATRRRMVREAGFPGKLDVFSPADLHQPERQHRLCWKFFRMVQRRATGIREDMLHGTVPGV
jgi:hypothetical protein